MKKVALIKVSVLLLVLLVISCSEATSPDNSADVALNKTLEGYWFDSKGLVYSNDHYLQKDVKEVIYIEPEGSTNGTIYVYSFVPLGYISHDDKQVYTYRETHYKFENGSVNRSTVYVYPYVSQNSIQYEDTEVSTYRRDYYKFVYNIVGGVITNESCRCGSSAFYCLDKPLYGEMAPTFSANDDSLIFTELQWYGNKQVDIAWYRRMSFDEASAIIQ